VRWLARLKAKNNLLDNPNELNQENSSDLTMVKLQDSGTTLCLRDWSNTSSSRVAYHPKKLP